MMNVKRLGINWTTLCPLGCATVFSIFLSPALAQDQGGLFYDGKPGSTLDPSIVGQTGFDVYGPNLQNTAFQALSDVSLTVQVSKNAGNKSFTFGTFAYDDTPNSPVNWSKDAYGYPQTLSQDFVTDFADGTSTQNGGIGATSITQVKAGQLVGVWVQMDGQTALYSLNGLQGAGSNIYTYNQLGNGNSNQAVTWNDVTVYFNPSGSPTSGYQNSPIALNLTVGAAATASGSPLPGVWATMALMGAAGTYLRRKKN